MNQQSFSALVSVLVLLYARHLNKTPRSALTEDQRRELDKNVMFYTIFGVTALFLSYF